MDGLRISQNQILGLAPATGFALGLAFNCTVESVTSAFMARRLIERTGDNRLALQEAVERQVLSEMRLRGQIVQSCKRDTRDFQMCLAAIIAFHPPLAAALDLNPPRLTFAASVNSGRRVPAVNCKIAVGMPVYDGVAPVQIAVERREIDRAFHNFGRAGAL